MASTVKISDIMTRNPDWVDEEDTVQHAAKKMKTHNIGILAVCKGSPDKLVGVLTDRDIVTRAVAGHKSTDTTKVCMASPALQVREIMTPHVESVTELDTVAKACAVMKEAMIRRVFVVDHRTGVKELVGVVSLDDLAFYWKTLSGDVLRGVAAVHTSPTSVQVV